LREKRAGSVSGLQERKALRKPEELDPASEMRRVTLGQSKGWLRKRKEPEKRRKRE